MRKVNREILSLFFKTVASSTKVKNRKNKLSRVIPEFSISLESPSKIQQPDLNEKMEGLAL
jgi:hypothetical protein